VERAKWGANTHKTVCRLCGGVHETKREKRECHKRDGKSLLVPEPVRETRLGSEITRYEGDPLRGDKRAHAIARKLREGHSPRKIAKRLNVPLADVQEVLTKTVLTASKKKP